MPRVTHLRAGAFDAYPGNQGALYRVKPSLELESFRALLAQQTKRIGKRIV